MFGFLEPRSQPISYRAAYSRCCQHQRFNSGAAALTFLSYEAVFLYLFWLDATGHPASLLPQRRCCWMRLPEQINLMPDREIQTFCSAVGVLLASIKLDDEIRDHRSLRARIARRILTRPMTESRTFFVTLDPDFAVKTEAFVGQHVAMERNGQSVALDEYCLPTAEAFGYLFGTAAHLPDLRKEQEFLKRAGEYVGAALVSFDCGLDWKFDRRAGNFTPLPDERAVASAFEYSADNLDRAREMCARRFGSTSQSAWLLGEVLETRRAERFASPPAQPLPLPRRVFALLSTGAGMGLALAQDTQPRPSASDSGDCGFGQCLCCCLVGPLVGGVGKGCVTETGNTDCAGRKTYTADPGEGGVGCGMQKTGQTDCCGRETYRERGC